LGRLKNRVRRKVVARVGEVYEMAGESGSLV